MSVVAETFYTDHLSGVPLQTLNQLIKIVCADGNQLLYLDYV